MANKQLFKAGSDQETTNEAGGKAYKMSDKQALAQYAVTGCFNNTFYASGQDQLDKVKELVSKVDHEFVSKVAVYSRQKGNMKDVPAFLLAYLAAQDKKLFAKTFFQVCDNAKMLRNFAQIIRSGVVGRKSFGTLPKRVITQWFNSKSDEALFRSSIGNDPSIADLIKMVHPKPENDGRNALYGYFLGKEYNEELLPNLVKQFEAFKKDGEKEIPNVPFEMLTALPLKDEHWKQIARNASWTQTRMNLNTFLRHKVFEDQEIVKLVVDKLTNHEEIYRAKVFPYQLMSAWLNVNPEMPVVITNALQDAMEVSINNVPTIEGKVYVLPDVSGSMHSPITGQRGSATSKMLCVHIAGLVAAAIMRKNPETEVIPFAESARIGIKLNPKDSMITNAEKIFKQPGGGTNCSAPLLYLNMQKKTGKAIVFVSDSESWLDSNPYKGSQQTETKRQWDFFVERNPEAKMVAIDLTPNTTVQVQNDKRIVNIGGFSDGCFDVMREFINAYDGSDDFWIKEIEVAIQDK